MRRRCSDPYNNRYKYYGGKGIKVCEEWENSFKKFCEDMGDKPSSGHSIERIDINKHYTKENCIWATRVQQARNKSNNVLIEYGGKIITLKELSILTNISYKLIHQRYKRYKTKDLKILLCKKLIKSKYFFNGNPITVGDLAKILGVSTATFNRKKEQFCRDYGIISS